MALAIAYTCPCGAAYVALQHQVGLPQPCLLCGRVLEAPAAPGVKPRVLEEESASAFGSPFRLLKRRRSRSPLWPWLAFAACLAVLAGLGLLFFTKPTKGPLVSPHERGRSALAEHQYPDAILAFGEALEQDPADANAYLGRAEAYLARGGDLNSRDELNRALDDCKQALRLNSTLLRGYCLESQAQIYLHEYALALDLANQAVQRAPSDAQVYLCRGQAKARLGESDKALEDFSRAVQLDGNLARAYGGRALAWLAKGEIGKAGLDANRAIELDDKDPSLYLDRAKILLETGDEVKALTDCHQACVIGPRSVETHIARGLVYLRKGEEGLAYEEAKAVFDVNPKSPAAFAFRALVHQQAGKTQAALVDCNEAAWIDPKDARSHLVRSRILCDQGKWAEAEIDCARVIKMDPQAAASALACQAECRFFLHEDAQAVLDDCQLALRSNPRNADALLVRSRINILLDEPLKAEGDFKEAVRIAGPGAWLRRGDLFSRERKLDQALADYQEALRMDEHFARAHLASARLFAQKQLADRAITEAALAIGISPSNISAHVLRGAAYLEIARDADALADAKEAIRLGDTSALVFAIQGRAHLHLGLLEQAKNDLDKATLLDPQWIPDRDEAKRRLTSSTASKSSPSSNTYAAETAGLVHGLEQDSNGLEFIKRNKWWFLAGFNLLVIILVLFIYQARKRYFL